MAGIYLHIPFCKSRCIYCGFYSTTSLEWRQRYVDALCLECRLRRNELSEPIHTIYIGGGTPSQLTTAQLHQLFDSLLANYPLPALHGAADEGLEITIEVNPDDVTSDFADALASLPVNRVSMGVQTFDDARLSFLHRRHTVAQVSQAVSRLRSAGIANISIDLMYGFPNETLADWRHDIDSALALGVEHISAYCLSIEEGTPLWRLKTKDERLSFPDEELERQMYELLMDRLAAAGYEHYEISNFARPSRRSRHNAGYWHDTPYIGLGAAAHSYDGRSRSWNVSDIRQYVEAINEGNRPCDGEQLDADTHYNDRIATALRTSDGLDLDSLSEVHRHYCLQEARRFLADGLLMLRGQRLVLTRRGLFVSDYVMSSLMRV